MFSLFTIIIINYNKKNTKSKDFKEKDNQEIIMSNLGNIMNRSGERLIIFHWGRLF